MYGNLYKETMGGDNFSKRKRVKKNLSSAKKYTNKRLIKMSKRKKILFLFFARVYFLLNKVTLFKDFEKFANTKVGMVVACNKPWTEQLLKRNPAGWTCGVLFTNCMHACACRYTHAHLVNYEVGNSMDIINYVQLHQTLMFIKVAHEPADKKTTQVESNSAP